tara:strand:- start:5230 stop:5544 length:315 start_codon:yes stop_codon:yes gene_type:complete
MGAFMATLGYNAEHEGMGGPGSDPEGTGTSQGDTTGEGDTPGGLPGPRMIRDQNFQQPKDTLKLNYVAPALAYSAPPQQTDIQNNFSTSSQYAQRYGLSGRTHF